jgi:hypothetical protein
MQNVGSVVLAAAVAVQINTFWNVMPCSIEEVHRRFGGTYCLHIQN